MRRRHRTAPGVLLLFSTLWFLSGLESGARQHVSIRDGDGPLERCDQLDISFDDRAALRGEEAVTIPLGDSPLDVHLQEHGGIALREASGRQHEITLCKAVPEDAAGDLAAIRARVNRSSVTVTGPEGSRWVGYLLVRSPRGTEVALRTANGPVRVDTFDGRLTVETVNGPIRLSQVRGTTIARAQNGPIKLQGDGGHISLETQNGPIGVRLLGSRWNAGKLEARAQNGPLSVAVPAQYQSGVEITSSGRGPWSCRGPQGCGSGTRGNGTEPRRLLLGEGPTQVTVSTVNGPVKVLTGVGGGEDDGEPE